MIDLNLMREQISAGIASRESLLNLVDENLKLRAALIEQACSTAFYNGQGNVQIITRNPLGELAWRRYLTPSAKALLDPEARE